MTAGIAEPAQPSTGNSASPASPVRRRVVWYFHGFDPAAAARYRRIFAAASARLGVEVRDLPGGGEGWLADRGDTVTEIRLLRYEDLVRSWRAPPLPRRLARGAAALAGYARGGALRQIGRAAPRTAGLAVAPVIALAGPVLLATPAFGAGPVAGVLSVAAALAAALWLVRRSYLDVVADLFAWMRAFARADAAVAAPYLARVQSLARRIDADGADEVLVVGHSLGGIAAILAAAEVVDRAPASQPPAGAAARLSLLTLGSTHGIVLAQDGPGRDRLAQAVGQVAAAGVFWVDVSSPRDAFCVPLTDPLLLIGDAARPGMVSPRVLSARLARAPRIPGDRRTVFRAMRRHMGYLLAPEPGSGFDYADAASGPLTLADRFGARGNSPRARMWPG